MAARGSVAPSGSEDAAPPAEGCASRMAASKAEVSIGPFSSSGRVVKTAVSSFTPACSTGAPQKGQNLPAMGSSLPQFLQSIGGFLL